MRKSWRGSLEVKFFFFGGGPLFIWSSGRLPKTFPHPLEAMVGQIEQETLEEQGHALLHSWQTAVCVADVFQEKGLVKSAQQMRRVCDAAKQTIDKVLSPETIRAAPKPTIARVVADHTMVGQPEVACVVADRATEPHQQPEVARVVADRATEPHHQPEVARVVSDRATQPDHHVACVVADRAAEPDQDFASSYYESSEGQQRSVEDLLSEVEQRSLCVQGGGEIPCHFTTLTTAIYHWDDLATCLQKYETAVRSHRGGRSDPLEPSEIQLSEERRRVLRYPGVVAWFTAYKMELFYKHVLCYEDGQGVFEWGAGGIMHLHSINVGSCMPRVDPTAAGMQRPDATTARIAARFAETHEEYLTDWSLGKHEKWTFNEVDSVPARFRQVGSPVHTDSESDGSEDLEGSEVLEKCFRRTQATSGLDVGAACDTFGQHVVNDDVDFVRVFPTPTTMSYVAQNAVRATHVLTRAERETLRSLEVSLHDTDWHPCRISVSQKALLMTNNCRLVRRTRRKWYRRLTEKCNMHDRHSGGGVEIGAVHIEEEETEGVSCVVADRETVAEEPDQVSCVVADHGTAAEEDPDKVNSCVAADHETVVAQGVAIPLQVATLNMHLQSPGEWLLPLIHDYDVVCLQEVTAECLNDLVAVGKARGFHVVSPLQRGQVSPESFDVCLLLNITSLDSVRVKISPLPWPSGRCLLQAHVLVRANGAFVSVATAHLTATAQAAPQRQAELKFIFGSLEALKSLDAAIFAGDVNMRRDEPWAEGVRQSTWRDVWEVEGSSESLCGTWCPETMAVEDARVRQWRFDRIYTWCQFGLRKETDPMPLRAGAEPMPLRAGLFATVQVQPGSFGVEFQSQDLDHAFVSATLLVEPLVLGPREMHMEHLKILRPGLGSKIARKPGERESCAQKQHGHTYCGKDYEKPRLLPGMGSILEDPRRKALFRLYTRRNCDHVNTHDPLKAMGLVANVDDQVVLTVHAAVNYLTKYMGKLGGGQSAQSRISGLIDDIVCRMGDRDTMTVASLLSKLFIHSAAPEEICSLEAWHLLLDLPRALSSRYVSSLNVKEEQQAFKHLTQVEQAKEEESVLQKTKVSIYVDRFNMKTEGRLSEQTLEQMSLFQFNSRVERRRNSLYLRAKPNIVKEKPYLRLDMRRREAGGGVWGRFAVFFSEEITVTHRMPTFIFSRLYMFDSCLRCTCLHAYPCFSRMSAFGNTPRLVVFMTVWFIVSHDMTVGNVTFKFCFHSLKSIVPFPEKRKKQHSEFGMSFSQQHSIQHSEFGMSFSVVSLFCF